MTHRDALWSAIICEAEKFGHRITKAKRDRYLRLVKQWEMTK